MITVPFVIFFIITGLIVGIVLYFFRKNKEIEQVHLHRVLALIESISLQKKQINFRVKGLQEYNFLKHNLDESLSVQPEIHLI